jgi:putative membrane protein
MPRANLIRMSSAVAFGAFALVACRDRNDNGIPDSVAVSPSTVDSAAGAVASGMTADTPDAEIVGALWTASMGEVDYSKIAAAKATNPEVKKLARQMVTDHGAMVKDIEALMAKAGITPDTTQGKGDEFIKDNRQDIADLNAKTGTDFDNEYVEEQIDAHQKVLDLLEDVDEDADNPELKAMVEAAKPKVQAHLDAFKALKEKSSKM